MALTNDQLEKLTKLSQFKKLGERVEAVLDTLEVVKQETAETGFLSTYSLKLRGAQKGVKINIPKDYLVKNAEVKTVETADTPVAGYKVGQKYIDFTVNTVDGTGNESHLYILVDDLIQALKAGNGINVAADNTISVVIDANNANGLSVGANGVALANVTASTSGVGGSNGAMLATDKEKLDNVSVEANKVTVTTEKAGTIEIDGTTKTIVEFATDAEVTEVLDEVLPLPSSGN